MAKPFYDEEYEDVRQWNELINSEYFCKLTDKINNDKAALQKEIDKLINDPSFDNSIKAASLGKAKERLNSLLLYFDFIKEKKSQLDKRIVEKKTVLGRFQK